MSLNDKDKKWLSDRFKEVNEDILKRINKSNEHNDFMSRMTRRLIEINTDEQFELSEKFNDLRIKADTFAKSFKRLFKSDRELNEEINEKLNQNTFSDKISKEENEEVKEKVAEDNIFTEKIEKEDDIKTKRPEIITEQLTIDQTSGNNSNYILAKEAIFNNGDNVIVENKQGVFSKLGEMIGGFLGFGKKEKEENKKHNNLMAGLLKGIGGFVEKIKGAIDLMSIVGFAKMLVIGTAISAAVAGVLKAVDMSLPYIKQGIEWIIGGIKKLLDINKEKKKEFNDKANTTQSVYNKSLTTGQNLIDYKNNIDYKDQNKNLKVNSSDLDMNKYANIESYGFDITNPLDLKSITKSGDFGSGAASLLGSGSVSAWQDFKKGKEFSHEGKRMKLSFPVPIKIAKVEPETDGTAAILIKRAKDKEDIGVVKELMITGILEIFVPIGKKIPPKTYFADVGPKYKIIGDLNAFMEDVDFSAYQQANNLDSTEIDSNYKNLASNEKNFTSDLNKDVKEMEKKYLKKEERRNHIVGRTVAALGDAVDLGLTSMAKNPNEPKGDVPSYNNPAPDSFNPNVPVDSNTTITPNNISKTNKNMEQALNNTEKIDKLNNQQNKPQDQPQTRGNGININTPDNTKTVIYNMDPNQDGIELKKGLR